MLLKIYSVSKNSQPQTKTQLHRYYSNDICLPRSVTQTSNFKHSKNKKKLYNLLHPQIKLKFYNEYHKTAQSLTINLFYVVNISMNINLKKERIQKSFKKNKLLILTT